MLTPVDPSEVLVRSHGGVIRHIRSTVLCSSVTELRARGLFDRYRAIVPDAAAEQILSAVAATWMPIATAEAHFGACELLGVSGNDVFEMGRASGQRLQQSVANAFLLLARGVGVTPLAIFPTYARVWGRHFDGGTVIVERVGPKDVVLAIREQPLMRYAYFRHGFRGMTDAVVRMFAQTVYVRETAATALSATLRIAWV